MLNPSIEDTHLRPVGDDEVRAKLLPSPLDGVQDEGELNVTSACLSHQSLSPLLYKEYVDLLSQKRPLKAYFNKEVKRRKLTRGLRRPLQAW